MPAEKLGDIGSDDTPVQLVGLRLAYDEDEEQYYVETRIEDDLWALEVGQLLLVKADQVNGTGAGSDIPVRVVRRVRSEENSSCPLIRVWSA